MKNKREAPSCPDLKGEKTTPSPVGGGVGWGRESRRNSRTPPSQPPPCGGRSREAAHYYPPAAIRENARELRRQRTDAETLLWRLLRAKQLGAKFRKQHPVGQYIADFASLSPKLIIELDGGQHNEESNKQRDDIRTAFLESQGFVVLRFWNDDVLQQPEVVAEVIYNFLQSASCPPPGLPPTGGGEDAPSLAGGGC